jgi:DHA2 family multidrug resistance protein
MNPDLPASKRWPITVSVMLASVMAALDQTIANVALPHIQGSVSASQDQIAWVLTSYLIASAIMIPMTGWLVNRIGRKTLFLISIIGFTLMSMLCGLATSLPQIVMFRLLQGFFGAPLMPLAQTVMLDSNPPEKHAQAMALWGSGTLLGPILGPAMGGWLTEHLSWRWVFFINLPIGILAAAGIWLFMSREEGTQPPKRFDFLGFASIVAFVGGTQLVLDRGPGADWFQAPEIWIEAIIAVIGLWIFITHTLTAKQPFFDRRLAQDRNFITTTSATFFCGIPLVSTSALLPSLMQGLLGYPVLDAGLMSMPRGIGTMVAMVAFSKAPRGLDPRVAILGGIVLTAIAMFQMMHFDLSMSVEPLIVSGLLHGAGLGLMFVALTTTAFSTLAPDLRPEGSALFSLIRGLGASIGVSITQAMLVANAATMHASLAAHLDPSNPVVRADIGQSVDLTTVAGLAGVEGEISRQALMVAYVDDFKLLMFVTFACLPLLLFIRPSRAAPGEAVHVAID